MTYPLFFYYTLLLTKDGLRQAISLIWDYGFCIVSNTPISTMGGTKLVAERMGPIYVSPYAYDGYWELTSKQADTTSDASYTSVGLHPHTDGTYFMTAPG